MGGNSRFNYITFSDGRRCVKYFTCTVCSSELVLKEMKHLLKALTLVNSGGARILTQDSMPSVTSSLQHAMLSKVPTRSTH